ncbi:hypothetical protein IBE48_09585 [Francisella philomiragia]|uniref:Uncharacterized protein n=3 Tax=Francisella philomiragia TaxID=28110 RepID=A0AAW3DDA3_9GAMM|nr:hypothetical protein [Francisella philomiragia]KFJ43610.1 hypothetical protein DR78_1945 [Francisella philomiragia]MBK2255701.1 hypothetical protein [Francisella philomiragia]MBK2274015.1 hypothetical protein [Francisella philomiragia]MBK2277856.1 hypothetical protein [Francisella philomiragia]MBK2281802.1 hypothetical protein [Francisella philomiragia]
MRKITTLIILVVISNLAFAQQTSISISSNGQYAISVDGAGNAYLWNLREHSSENIAGKYNYKSAYFIPNSDYYLLQDKNDTKIIVNNISGKEVFSFDPKLEANSHAISSDLKYYVTSNYEFDTYMFLAQEDKKRHLIVNWCMGDHGGKQYQGNNPSDCAYGNMQFNFTKDNKRLLATSSGYLYDFDLTNNHWKSIIVGGPNAMNAIDPNGEFVYTADSHTGIKYNLETGKVSNSAFYGTANIPDVTYLKNNEKKVLMDSISNFKFIDKDKIIVTFKGLSQPYLWAFFYTPSQLDWNKKDGIRPIFHSSEYTKLVDNPLDYIMGNYNIEPRPNVDGYNTTFDTSVEAHKLVIGQANGNGIMVYNYNPNDETLKLDWVGEPPKVEDKKEEKSKGWFW